METLSSHELTIFLTSVGFMLILARILSAIVSRVNMPTLTAELLAGILLGPTVLGTIFPEVQGYFFPKTGVLPTAYTILFNLSSIMLLFLAGTEIDEKLVSRGQKSIFITSAFAIIIPFAMGVYFASEFFDFFHGTQFSATPYVFPLIFGALLTISSLPTMIRILMGENMLNTDIGITVIGVAVITDLIGWIGFSSILVYANPTLENIQILYTILYVVGFVIIAFIISGSKKYFDKFMGKGTQDDKRDKTDQAVKTETLPLNIAILFGICLLAAAFTNMIGIHPSLGAFLSGILCKRFLGENAIILKQIRLFIMNFFAPIFFISIGLQLNFIQNFNLPMIVAVIALAMIGKILAAFLGALFSGFQVKPAVVIAACLNSRGTLEIIMGALALKLGLIYPQLFVSIVIMAILAVTTTLFAIPLLVKVFKIPRND